MWKQRLPRRLRPSPGELSRPLRSLRPMPGEEGGASLASANRVLGVGRGLTSKDQLALAEALAAALDAEIACSLSLCDDYRWFEHSRVVGTSTQRSRRASTCRWVFRASPSI